MRIFLLLIIISSYIFASSHIFVYHRFGDVKYKSTSTSVKELRKEFNYLKDNGYTVVPLKKIVDKLRAKQDIPDKWVALTIDDSYKSFYQNGLPIFKEFGYPFTLFVYVKATDKRYGDFMTWEQVRDAKKYGDIQLHSYSHPHLVSLSDEEIIKDTKKAQKIFKKEMGYDATYYAYPFGEYNDRVKSIFKSLGFESILNQNSGAVDSKSDVYDIDRIAMVGKVNLKPKLRINALNAQIMSPKAYPADKMLKEIKAKVDKSIKSVEVYVTDYGWKRVKVKDGILTYKLNKKLKKSRVRVIIKANNSKMTTKILVKGDKNARKYL
jgi:peptidoglycan/xylan/chitin deacetylase (PgdA/CDA1 family)